MGSTKSLQYEVLVYPPPEEQSANSVPQRPLMQTQFRRFPCDRENMQQYWIPEGFRPVLVHRHLLMSSLAVTNDFNDSRKMTSNASPLRQRNSSITLDTSTGGNLTHRSKRRRIFGSSKHPEISLVTFKATALYYKTKCKELMNNGTIANPPIDPPSKIIGKMWSEEPEHVKKHYERLARKTTKHRSVCPSSKTTTNQPPQKLLSHDEPFEVPVALSTTIRNRKVLQTSSEDFTRCHPSELIKR
ncbi:15230_t:CDS:1 [Acaulospora colombiana]|uniref:15230_t:CDS:1 n=1 Tax=Acaulospora colombiana TaxID=27376 RepID=A0ACA9L4R0_9GLOM|nr:15230_t:CDS:1 [Acaulospora colombiana]